MWDGLQGDKGSEGAWEKPTRKLWESSHVYKDVWALDKQRGKEEDIVGDDKGRGGDSTLGVSHINPGVGLGP